MHIRLSNRSNCCFLKARKLSRILVIIVFIGQHLLANPDCVKVYNDEHFQIIGKGR